MRKSGLELSSALAVGAVIAALSVAWSVGLSVHDPDSATGPTFVRLPAIVLIVLLADVVPRAVVRARVSGDLRLRLGEVARERWTAANLRFTFVGLVGWYATYAAIRNLKSLVPFVNDNLYDAELDALDRTMMLGNDPSDVLHTLLGTGAAAHVLSFFYLLWIVALPVSLAVALVWSRRPRVSAWWVTAVSVDWIIGVMLNYALPTVGPIYERPADFAHLADTPTSALQDSMWADRVEVLAAQGHADIVQNIAAFASLHVAIATTACVVAHRAGLSRVLVWSLRVFLGLTVLATVYFGWHYASDVVAGLVLGCVAAWVAERFTDTASADDPDSQLGASDLSGRGAGQRVNPLVRLRTLGRREALGREST